MDEWHRFASHMAELRDGCASSAEILVRAQEAFIPLLDEALLPAVERIAEQPGMPWLLHASSAVTVFVMSGAPGYLSSVHDHGSWGMVGQVLGEEIETRYHKDEALDGLVRLEPIERRRMRPRDVVTILPPDHDVHQVATLGDARSVTVHAFARDLLAEGFSVFEPELYCATTYRGPYSNVGATGTS